MFVQRLLHCCLLVACATAVRRNGNKPILVSMHKYLKMASILQEDPDKTVDPSVKDGTCHVEEGKILVGFAEIVTDGQGSLAQCIGRCDRFRRLGSNCLSGFYYQAERLCILTSESRLTQPQLFAAENKTAVTYFDYDCDKARLPASN